MKFKVGDKVKRKDGSRFSNGSYVVTIEAFKYNNLWLKETQSHLSEDYVELVKEEKEMTHEYEEGKWYMWGGGECPLHPEDKVLVKTFSTIDGSVSASNGQPSASRWLHSSLYVKVFAFKITKKYAPPVTKEMTVEEISKALGYDVKIVKG